MFMDNVTGHCYCKAESEYIFELIHIIKRRGSGGVVLEDVD